MNGAFGAVFSWYWLRVRARAHVRCQLHQAKGSDPYPTPWVIRSLSVGVDELAHARGNAQRQRRTRFERCSRLAPSPHAEFVRQQLDNLLAVQPVDVEREVQLLEYPHEPPHRARLAS
jgi:hypothetical protein